MTLMIYKTVSKLNDVSRQYIYKCGGNLEGKLLKFFRFFQLIGRYELTMVDSSQMHHHVATKIAGKPISHLTKVW